MDLFHNFSTIYVFEVRESIADIPTELWCLGVLENPSQGFRFERYWWFCLINFWNFYTIHVFEVRESIDVEFTKKSAMFRWPQILTIDLLQSNHTLLRRNWLLCHVDFANFMLYHMMLMRAANHHQDIHTERPCLGNLQKFKFIVFGYKWFIVPLTQNSLHE